MEQSPPLTCPRDRVETRLQCATCGTPICPNCFVRTPVGLRCETCAAPIRSARRRRTGQPRRSVAIPALIGAVVGAAVMWAVLARPGSRPTDAGGDPEEEATSTTAGGRTVAAGQLPDGTTWELQARRVGPAVCTRLMLQPGGAPPEECEGPGPSRSAFGTIRTRAPRGDRAAPALTWGTVSLAAERVRFTTADGHAGEVQTVGSGTGIGVRFFVSVLPRNVAATFVALGADGQELSRVELPAVPPR